MQRVLCPIVGFAGIRADPVRVIDIRKRADKIRRQFGAVRGSGVMKKADALPNGTAGKNVQMRGRVDNRAGVSIRKRDGAALPFQIGSGGVDLHEDPQIVTTPDGGA